MNKPIDPTPFSSQWQPKCSLDSSQAFYLSRLSSVCVYITWQKQRKRYSLRLTEVVSVIFEACCTLGCVRLNVVELHQSGLNHKCSRKLVERCSNDPEVKKKPNWSVFRRVSVEVHCQHTAGQKFEFIYVDFIFRFPEVCMKRGAQSLFVRLHHSSMKPRERKRKAVKDYNPRDERFEIQMSDFYLSNKDLTRASWIIRRRGEPKPQTVSL